LCSVSEKRKKRKREIPEGEREGEEQGEVGRTREERRREERFRAKLQTRIHSLGKPRQMAIPRHINFKLSLEPPAAPTNE